MNKLSLITGFFVLFCSSAGLAQDGIFWGHNITFENIRLNANDKSDSLISLEFYVNERSISTECVSREMKSKKPAQYILSYGCSAIGGESQVRKIKCPDIYLKLAFRQGNKNKKKYITRLVPFMFESTAGPVQKIDVPKIDINGLLTTEGAIVLIDATGNYKIVNERSVENKPVISNLVRFDREEAGTD